MEEAKNHIYSTLQELIARKSKRDGKPFTIGQLAKALEMPHSMISKILNKDPKKRVNNPRIDTLSKIVNFFKEDGFEITVDDLLNGFFRTNAIKVDDQETSAFSIVKTLPVYSMDAKLKSFGVTNIKLTTNHSENAIVLVLDEEIKPIFKKGSVFVIDPSLEPEDGMLVAVKIEGNKNILIRKFRIEGNHKFLYSYEGDCNKIDITAMDACKIIGVVVQANAKL